MERKIKDLIKKFLGVKDACSAFDEFCRYKYRWANDKEFNDLYSTALKKQKLLTSFLTKYEVTL